MSTKLPFHRFTTDDNITWRQLYERQFPQTQTRGTTLFAEGAKKLGLTPEHIPDFETLNQWFMTNVGWKLVSTPVQYSNGQDWFEALARKEFLITEYMRDRSDLEYTPLPDIWHDTFGHLPFMAHQWYADYIYQFALHAVKYTPAERISLGSLWWYTIEFGMVYENGELKALGAGLMSSHAELERAFSKEVRLIPYTLEAFDMSRLARMSITIPCLSSTPMTNSFTRSRAGSKRTRTAAASLPGKSPTGIYTQKRAKIAAQVGGLLPKPAHDRCANALPIPPESHNSVVDLNLRRFYLPLLP